MGQEVLYIIGDRIENEEILLKKLPFKKIGARFTFILI